MLSAYIACCRLGILFGRVGSSSNAGEITDYFGVPLEGMLMMGEVRRPNLIVAVRSRRNAATKLDVQDPQWVALRLSRIAW